jgi:transposase-like protein
MGTLAMSSKERRRMALMERVAEKALTLRMASTMLRVSYRQAKRIWRRYRREGDQGLVHRGRGRSSNRAWSAKERALAVKLYSRLYPDFGPVLACEHLKADHGITLDHETLRRWLVQAGFWRTRQRREVHRAQRERRPRQGDLVQMDGSEHDWFEGRGPRVVLMVMIDDATNTTLARFYPAEDTASAYDIFERYVRMYGLPAVLYPDRDSIYVCTRKANIDEELADRGPETQFGRAMRELGVDLAPAYSPQAKGRVERRHGLFQDRLVKELRLRNIKTLDAANAYLDESFLSFVNTRYRVPARDPGNGHLSRPTPERLAMTLSWQESRSVARDWTFSWHGRRLQIDARHASLGLAGRRITVAQRRDASLVVLYQQRQLNFRDAPVVPRPPTPPRPTTPRVPLPPAPTHPWRRPALTRRPAFPPPSDELLKAHSREAGNRAATVLNQAVVAH